MEESSAARQTHRQPLEEPVPPQLRERPVHLPANPVAPIDDNPYWQPLIDPMKVIGGVMSSTGLIVATTIVGGLIGAAIAINTPKMYSATAELLVDPRDLRIIDRDLTGGGLPSDATLAIVENQVRVLTSGTVLNAVVDKLSLDRDPEFNGDSEGGIGSLLSSLRSLVSFASRGGDGVDNSRALAIENLYEAVDVERGGKTFVISIRAKTESPDKSALIANTMTEVFLATYGDLQADTAGRASDELTSRLDELRKGVEAAERKVEAFKAENDIIDAQGRLITDDEIVKLNDQLSIARARTLELSARADSARGLTIDAILAGDLPEQINSPVLTELRGQFSTIQQEAERLGAKLGPRHPERVAVEAQVASARRQIERELRLVGSSIQVELRRAVELEQQLASRLAQLKARQAGLSEELVTLRELEREASAARAVYENFLLRARETGEQKDINTANMSVISRAEPPLEPTGTSRTMFTLMSALLGFAAGIGIGGARGALASLRDNAERRRRPTLEGWRSALPTTAEPVPRSETNVTQPDSAPTGTPTPTESVAERVAKILSAPSPKSRSEPQAEAEPPSSTKEPAMNRNQPPYPYGSPPGGPMPTAQGHPQGYPAAQPPFYGYPNQGPAPYGAYPPPALPTYPQPQAYMHQPYQPHDPWQGHYPAPGAYWPHQPQQMAPMAQPIPQAPYHSAGDAGVGENAAMNEIRESLREFREALKDLADSRTRRRFL